MVKLAAALVPEAKGQKRALLLSAYRSVAGCVPRIDRVKSNEKKAGVAPSITWLFIPTDRHHQSHHSAAQSAKLSKFGATSAGPSQATRFSGARSSGGSGSLVGGKYRLEVGAGGPRVSSGKSAVVDAVVVEGSDINKRVKVKLSKNLVTLQREAENLRRLAGCRSVIRVLDFCENCDRRGGHALVLEAGEEDLVGLVRRSGALGRGEIKRWVGWLVGRLLCGRWR